MKNAPEKIYGWLNSQLSIARHYGGCKFNGADYMIDYADPDQPLVRVDALRKEKKAAIKAEHDKRLIEALKARAVQGDLL